MESRLRWEFFRGNKRGYEESIELEVDDKKLVLFPAKWVK